MYDGSSSDDSTSSMNHNDIVVPADPTIPNSTDPSSPPSLDDAAGSSRLPSSSQVTGPFPQVKLRIKLGQATPMSTPQITHSTVKLDYGNNDEDETSGEESSFRFSAVNAHAIEDDRSEANSGANTNDQETPKKELRERKKADPSSSSSKKGRGSSKKRGRKAKSEKKDVKKEDDDDVEEEKEKNGDDNGDENDDEEEVFEVERIVDHNWEDGVLKYKVKWVGYGPEWDTWEPIEMLASATQRINEYKRSLPVETRQELEAGKKNKKKGGRPAKGATKAAAKRRRSESLFKDDESEDDKDDKDDDKDDDFKVDSGAAGSSKGRGRPPKSKGALKLFERPKRAADSEPRPKRQFLENRQGWLNETDSNPTDSEAEGEKEKKKEEKEEKKEVKEVKKERRVTESPAPKKETAKRRGAPIETTPVPVTNGARHSTARGSSAALVEGMYRHENGEVDVLIAEGRSQRIVQLREAFDLAGFGLVQYLADRFQFQA